MPLSARIPPAACNGAAGAAVPCEASIGVAPGPRIVARASAASGRLLPASLLGLVLAACQLTVVAPDGEAARPDRPRAFAARACRAEAQRLGLRVRALRRFSQVERRGRVAGVTALMNVSRRGLPFEARCTYSYRTAGARITAA